MQDVLGGDGLRAHPRFGERYVFRHIRIEVVADHDHVQVLVERVHGVGVGRVGRGGDAVAFASDADDVRRVSAACTLSVVHVDGAVADGRQRVFEKTGFIERVGVQLDLKIVFVGDFQAGVDHRRHGAPVLVDLQPQTTAAQLPEQRFGLAGIAASQKAEVDRPGFGSL